MEKFEMLYDYAEGTLDISKEEGLFADLAVDAEMRNEFRQLITLNSAVKNNRLLFLNDPVSKTRLMAGLGLGAGAGVATQTGFFSGIFGSLKTSYIIVSLLSCLISGAGVYYFAGGKGGGDTRKTSVNVASRENSGKREVPQVSSYETSASSPVNTNSSVNNNTHDSRTIIKYIIVKDRDGDSGAKGAGIAKGISPGSGQSTDEAEKSSLRDEVAEMAARAEKEKTIMMMPISRSELERMAEMNGYDFSVSGNGNKKEESAYGRPQRLSGSAGRNALQATLPYAPLPPLDYASPGRRGALSLEWKMNESWHMPQATISPFDLSKFNNNSLSLVYKFNDVFALGAEVRQETFFQQFSGTTAEGKFLYEQQPNLTTYGLLGRTNLGSLWGFQPFGQVFLGSTSVGAVVRFGGGFQYGMTEEFALVLGAEYSRLFYEFGQNNFVSAKYGFNYGIRYTLY